MLLAMTLDTSRVRAVLFDIDGTLRDTDDELIERGARVMRRVAGQHRADRWMRAFVMRAEGPLQHVLSYADKIGLDGLLNRVAERLSPGGHGGTRLVAGAAEVVRELGQRLALGVVSAGPAAVVAHFLVEHDLTDVFGVVVTGQTCRRTKPHPEPVVAAARALGVEPRECVMVGDTTADMRAGRAAGAQTVGMLTGFGERDELVRTGADVINETLPQLLATLGMHRDGPAAP
jgi:N-acetyl-D-muramate 6-phosphate phosphatase